jgi:tetratricopeptide (TPR) repeat protein
LNARPSWKVLTPTVLTSEGGATLTALPDGSILAGGKNPEKDAYTIVTRVEGNGITAIRLEALPDPSLANEGPGRHEAGNFHLTEIALASASPDAPSKSQAVALVRAFATYTRPPDHDTTLRDGPRGAIDGTHATRWDIWPRVGRTHVAFFETDRPVGGHGPTILTIRLDFRDPVFQRVNLGHFRLSVTSDPYPLAIERLQATDDLNGLAGAYYASGDSRHAMELLESTISQTGGDVQSWLAVALYYAEVGRNSDARAWYDRAQAWLREHPSDDAIKELALLARSRVEGLRRSEGLRSQ